LNNWLWNTGGFVILAWLLHYIPFFGMHRSLYLHHYLPAYMFSAMAAAQFSDYLLRRCTGWKKIAVPLAMGLLSMSVVATFFYFAPITYGTEVSTEALNTTKKWISSWDWP
jgi:dolichyl-phosphate-mannose-protein mannosyltransferase